jgi:hypothetical protein
VPQNATLLL